MTESPQQTVQKIRAEVESLIPKTTKTFDPNSLIQLPYPAPTYNLFPLFIEMFSIPALRVLVSRTDSQVHQYNEHNKYYHLTPLLKKLDIKESATLPDWEYTRQVALVNYIGYHTTKDKVVDATLDLITHLNAICEKGYAIATLAPLICVELADNTVCVMSYIAIYNKYQSLVQSQYGFCSFKEGGVPPEFK